MKSSLKSSPQYQPPSTFKGWLPQQALSNNTLLEDLRKDLDALIEGYEGSIEVIQNISQRLSYDDVTVPLSSVCYLHGKIPNPQRIMVKMGDFVIERSPFEATQMMKEKIASLEKMHGSREPKSQEKKEKATGQTSKQESSKEEPKNSKKIPQPTPVSQFIPSENSHIPQISESKEEPEEEPINIEETLEEVTVPTKPKKTDEELEKEGKIGKLLSVKEFFGSDFTNKNDEGLKEEIEEMKKRAHRKELEAKKVLDSITSSKKPVSNPAQTSTNPQAKQPAPSQPSQKPLNQVKKAPSKKPPLIIDGPIYKEPESKLSVLSEMPSSSSNPNISKNSKDLKKVRFNPETEEKSSSSEDAEDDDDEKIASKKAKKAKNEDDDIEPPKMSLFKQRMMGKM